MVYARFATTTTFVKNASQKEFQYAYFLSILMKMEKYRVQYYNLDMIILVGQLVNSKQVIIFKHWTNKILKDYLIKGYEVNRKRLDYLEKTIQLIDIANRIDDDLTVE